MSETTPTAGYPAAHSPTRTLAVRITDDLRAQLDVIAQLNDRSVTEEIRIALEAWVVTSKSDPKVLQRAETVRAEIEREAETKRNAISSIFGGTAPSTSGSRGRSKQASDDA
jgi:predicted transcriptional regulator